MLVKDKTPVENSHSIEWGISTKTRDLSDAIKEKAIRNRIDRDKGRFNYAASSELSWKHFTSMVLESIKRGHFSKEELEEIASALVPKV